jgi:thiamine biosynthesis lipoprotein ApbE
VSTHVISFRPKPFINKNKLDPEVPTSGKVLVEINNNRQDSRVIFEGEAKSSNVMHKAVPGSIEKRPRPTHSSIDKAFKLIGRKIKLYDDDAEVIAVKATKDGIFLEVEENVEGELIRYELEYENDVVPFL